MASKDNTFRSEASSRIVPELLSQLTETWKKREEDLLQKATDLEYKLKKKNEDYEVLIQSDMRHKEEHKVLEKKIKGLEDEVKRKVNEIGEMKMANDHCMKKIDVYRNIFLDLDVKVLHLEKVRNELMGSGCSPGDLEVKKPVAGCVVESSMQQMPSEKGESKKGIDEKFPYVIQIDDDDEDGDGEEDALKYAPSFKRKRGSGEIERTYDSNDDKCTISVLRRKPVTKEIQSVCNNDHVNKILTGTTSTTMPEIKAGIQQITSHSAIPFSDSGKSNDEKVEEANEPIIKKNTEKWETEAEMIIELGKSYELCMNAMCALHRQNIHVGDYDLQRINRLAEWLIDGEPERKLKKTPSELKHSELHQCQILAITHSAELFKVYQQNVDRFFPPRS